MVNRKIELNWFERSIEKIAPNAALNRASARIKLDLLGNKTRSYDAGRHTSSTDGWVAIGKSSANSEIRKGYALIVSRSRDLVRNNPYAKKAVQVITTNVVGTGVRPSIPKGALKDTQERAIMNAWRMWAETTECDHGNQFNFYGLTMMAWRASVESGNAFIRVINQSKFSAVPIKLQLLESDFLDPSRDGEVFENGNYTMMGIEFTAAGQRAAYWMFDKHPGDNMPIGNILSKRIPASEVMHIYEVLRPGQVLGIPHGTAAYLRLKNLDQFEDAQLTRQMIAACFSVFIKKNDPDDESASRGPDAVSERLSPGIIEYLEPGEDISFASPPGVSGYDPYVRSNLRATAAAYLITYEAMANDLSGVNFSSYRAGWLEMHRQFSQWQEFIIKGMICQPVWKHFLAAAKMSGAYKGAPVMAEWTPPRREMIDPLKEAKGLETMIRNGLTSRSEAVREMGWDPDKLFSEMVSEQTEQDSAGMMLASDPKHDATRVNFGVDAYLASKAKVATGKLAADKKA